MIQIQRLTCGLALITTAFLNTAQAAGTATATVTIDGNTYTYSGGTCTPNAGGVVVNIGVLPSDASPGTHPDYFGASIEKIPGHFVKSIVTFNKNGKSFSMVNATGEASSSGASFSGTIMMKSIPVTGSFSC